MRPVILDQESLHRLLSTGHYEIMAPIEPQPSCEIALYPSSLNRSQVWCELCDDNKGQAYLAPFRLGDKLWVKEAYTYHEAADKVYYAADDDKPAVLAGLPWIPAARMPSEYARLFITVKSSKTSNVDGVWYWVCKVISSPKPVWWASQKAI